MGNLLIHWFIPHQSNNHRAKALQIDALFIYILFFAFFNISVHLIHNSAPNILGYATDIYTESLLAMTNAKRESAGLPPLKLNNTLSQAAAAKAQDMFANNYWAHNSPVGKTPWDFIIGAGYKYTVAGENLAKNFSNSQGVVDAWMNSPSHRDNILKSNYQEVGFAIVNGKLLGEETTLVVQMFGSGSQVAQAKTLAKVSESKVVPTLIISPTTKPVEVPEEVSLQEVTNIDEVQNKPENDSIIRSPLVLARGMDGISEKPLVDIPRLTRTTAILFLLGIIFVLIVDAYLVTRKKIIRVAGHNTTHLLFFSALIIALSFVIRGSVL